MRSDTASPFLVFCRHFRDIILITCQKFITFLQARSAERARELVPVLLAGILPLAEAEVVHLLAARLADLSLSEDAVETDGTFGRFSSGVAERIFDLHPAPAPRPVLRTLGVGHAAHPRRAHSKRKLRLVRAGRGGGRSFPAAGAGGGGGWHGGGRAVWAGERTRVWNSLINSHGREVEFNIYCTRYLYI